MEAVGGGFYLGLGIAPVLERLDIMTANGLAFVFPGQGSQSVGMLSDLAENFPVVAGIFAGASAKLDY